MTGRPAGDDLREGSVCRAGGAHLRCPQRESAALLLNSLGDPELSDEQVERIRGSDEFQLRSAFAQHEQLIEQEVLRL